MSNYRSKNEPQFSLTYANFDITPAAGMPEKYPEHKDWGISAITNALVWRLVDVDMKAIAEANAAEVYGRIHVHERIEKTSVWDGDGEPVFITPEVVRDHIGLVSNWRSGPRPKWMAVVSDQVDAARALYLASQPALV